MTYRGHAQAGLGVSTNPVFMSESISREFAARANANITDSQSHTLLAAQPSGTYADPIFVLIANTSASATEIDLSDGTNTLSLYIPAGFTQGFVIPPGFPAQSDATAWAVQCTVGVSTIKITALFRLNLQ